jgi:PAS domain S-box-containing protein
MNAPSVTEALNAAGVAVLVLDEQDRVLDCNAPAAALLGRSFAELLGMDLADLSRLAGSTDDGAPFRIARWADTAGRARATVLFGEALAPREADRTHRALVQSGHAIRGANIGVFEYNPATDTVSVSDIWCAMLELEPDEAIDVQKEWRSRVHPDDLETALAPVNRCLYEGISQSSCEYRLYSRDRSRWRWMRTDIAVAERDAAGKPTLLIGAQTDITGRKSLEEALRISAAQFRSAFEGGPTGMALVGLDGAWLRINPALCDLLGYTEDEMRRTRFQALTHPDDLEIDSAQCERLLAGEIQSYTIEKRYIRSNGAIMWGKLSVALVRNVQGKPDHFVKQIVDVTEERRLSQMKTDFVSVVSHELRTPLTSILGALTLLQTYDDVPFPDEVQRLLFIAKTNGDRLNTLIHDILDFQKFSAREMRFTFAPERIGGLIDEALIASLALAESQDVKVSADVADRSLVAWVDCKRFHQVMANLLSNAVKFAEKGSVVDILVADQGPAIRIGVRNVGQGIPEAFRDHVFKPFSQASSLADLRSGGTGLGLSITRQIVEQMGGEIGFDSVTGESTTFWFTLKKAGPSGQGSFAP